MRELRVVDVVVVGLGCVEVVANGFSVSVEPVFSRGTRLRHPSEDACIAHLVVAQGHAKQIEASPALHRLRCGLLSVACSVAHAAGVGVAGPRVHHTQEATPRVALVVGIVASHESDHVAVADAEVVVDKSEQCSSQSEVSVVEVVVVIGVAVVACVVTNQSVVA